MLQSQLLHGVRNELLHVETVKGNVCIGESLQGVCRASPDTIFCRLTPAGSQLTLPSLTVREGLDLPPAPSLSREGSN